MTISAIATALRDIGPMSKAELARLLNLAPPTVGGQLVAMKKYPPGHHHRVIVVDWEQSGKGPRVPILGLSEFGESVPCPPPMSTTTVNERYWARNKYRLSVRRYGSRSKYAKAGMWSGLL